MTFAEALDSQLVAAEPNGEFTEAVLRFADGSSLYFCHRVGERWAKAMGVDRVEQGDGIAANCLSTVTQFRLNAKHLDIQFADGSRWEKTLPFLRSGESAN